MILKEKADKEILFMKSLIIVTSKDTEKYANYLYDLIGLNDDTEDAIVGTKDGEVKAAVYTVQDFLHNRINISSSQYVLYIGNDKFIKEKREHIILKYNQYGMRYGDFGKAAYLYINHVVEQNKYNDFIKLYEGIHGDVQKVKFKASDAAHIVSGALVGAGAELGTGLLGAATILAAGALMPVVAIGGAGALAAGGVSLAKKKKIDDQIKDQQYNCLILKYYLEGLNDFLNS